MGGSSTGEVRVGHMIYILRGYIIYEYIPSSCRSSTRTLKILNVKLSLKIAPRDGLADAPAVVGEQDFGTFKEGFRSSGILTLQQLAKISVRNSVGGEFSQSKSAVCRRSCPLPPPLLKYISDRIAPK